jgi:hypothetical protein
MTLARTLWETVEGEKSPFCRRCKSLVKACAFVGTSKQDACCLISMELQRSDVATLGMISGIMPPKVGSANDEEIAVQRFNISTDGKAAD